MGVERHTIWSYETVKESRHGPELGRYLTYGLRAWRKTEAGGEEVDFIPDVTTQPRFAELLAELFNRCQLSPLHFREVLEDMLP